MAVWDTRHQSGHYMVMDCLRGELSKELTGYLRKVRRFPLWPLRHELVLVPENLFSELKTKILKPYLRERVRQACISDNTRASIDSRLSALQEGAQRTVRRLS